MKLIEVPWNQIKVGDKCRSMSGSIGTVKHFDSNHIDNGRKGWIEILWESGNTSKNYMLIDGQPFLSDVVEYLGVIT